MAAFEERDGRDWQVQIDEEGFKQWWCYVEDSPVIMMKTRSIQRAPAAALVHCAQDFEIRRQWDSAFADMKIFYRTPDELKARMTFTFKSPAPLITSDRDFYIQELTRRDWP